MKPINLNHGGNLCFTVKPLPVMTVRENYGATVSQKSTSTDTFALATVTYHRLNDIMLHWMKAII